MAKTNISELLAELPLFEGCSEETVKKLSDNPVLRHASGDIIYSPSSQEKKLIILTDGQADVYSADSQKKMLLRTLGRGNIVGIANLFSDSPFVSNIVANKPCETLQISKEVYAECLESDYALMYNFLSFLSDKICYLNKKILCLTAGSAERRLAIYLDSLGSEDSFSLPHSMTSLSEMLDLGRASLYRAFDKLQSDGFILRNGKNITLLDRHKMLEHYTI